MFSFTSSDVGLFPLVVMSFALSSFVCWLIVNRSQWEARGQAMLTDIKAKQAMHRLPTPRIGGLAIIPSFFIVVGLNASSIERDILTALAAVVIVFLVGFKEDIYRNVSPKARLFAAFLSAGLAVYLSESMITHLDLPGEAALLALPALWLFMTLIWSAGLCHALNLIDGLNGLASGYAIIASVALALVAVQAGEQDITVICMILIGALVGFYVFNWPFGKIFLGDGGAYGIGHILAWLGIVLSARSAEFSPMALLLILFFPVTETILTIARRLINRRAVDQPDRLHLHHIVVRLVSLLAMGRLNQTAKNSMAAVILYPIMCFPALLGVVFWNKPANALVSLLVCFFAFVIMYRFLVQSLAERKLRRRSRTNTILTSKTIQEFEVSRMSGIFIDECLAVDISITRHLPDGEWRLKAIADQAPGRTWDQTFKSDVDAWDAFMKTLKREGIESIVGFAPRMKRTN